MGMDGTQFTRFNVRDVLKLREAIVITEYLLETGFPVAYGVYT
jgi:hypothetical protein